MNESKLKEDRAEYHASKRRVPNARGDDGAGEEQDTSDDIGELDRVHLGRKARVTADSLYVLCQMAAETFSQPVVIDTAPDFAPDETATAACALLRRVLIDPAVDAAGGSRH